MHRIAFFSIILTFRETVEDESDREREAFAPFFFLRVTFEGLGFLFPRPLP